MSICSKLKSVLFFLIAIAIFSGGFLTSPTKTSAEVLSGQERMNLITPCAYSIDGNHDEQDNSGNNIITFGAITTADGGKTIKINANVGSSGLKEYIYNYESNEEIGSGTAMTYVNYFFKNSVYGASKLKVNGAYDPNTNGLTTTISGFEITDYSSGNDNYKTFAEKFNSKVSKNITMSCKNATVFGAGTYDTSITFNGDSAPTIKISGNSTLSRPTMTFKLSYVLHPTSGAIDNNVFLFTYNGSDAKYKNIAVKFFQNGSGFISECNDFTNYGSCDDFTGAVVKISNLMDFINHVYNPKASTGSSTTCDASNPTIYVSSNPDKKLANWTGTPDIKCINASSNGWLAKWGITVNDVSFTNPTGESSQWMMDCGITTNIFSIASPSWYVGQALCGIIQGLGYLADWIVDGLFKGVFDALRAPPVHLQNLATVINPLTIQTAHAAGELNESSIIEALTAGSSTKWVVPAWKFVLTLTDLFLVVILLFLGIVNILHIQYDTYAIKKMLPLLIVGVVLANFSLLIMRMLVDSSNILTHSFMGSKPGDMVHDLITASKFSKVTDHGFFTSFGNGWEAVGILLLGVIFAFFATAAFLILGVMFYIRYAVILLLAIAAPLAFIALAFPPTQSLFKQWWSLATKFVYMKPISLFLIYIAIAVKGTGGSVESITAWMIIVFLVYMAIMVPWKLGGAVMSAWGGAMGSLFGTKKDGWARKPVDDWWQRRKDQTGSLAKVRFPGLFAGSEADRIKNESMKKSADSAVKQRAHSRNDVTAWEGKAKGEEDKLKDLINKRTLALEEGKLDLNWWLRLRLVGVKNSGQMAQDLFKNAASLEISTKNLEAHRKDATWGAIIDIGRDNAGFSQQIDALKGKGIGLDTIEVDGEGKIKQKTLYKLDKNGQVEKDANGNPIQDVATYRDYMEGAAFARMSGLAAKDPKIAQNYFNSAAEMEKKAAEFARTHTELDGKPILYNSFMDKNKSGRIFSVTTSWMLDEISTNTLNENAETMPVRFKNGGYGWRNNRGTHADLVNLAKGEYSKVSPTAIGPAVAEYRTWLEFVGRKGGKNRGRFFADFLDNVDSGEIYGENNKGRLLRSVLEKENSIREGATDEFLAEAILGAKRRGLDNFGGINFSDVDFKGGSTQEVIASLKKQKDFSSINTISAHPEIFRQLDLTASNNTRAQRNMLDGISDLLEESSNFCGAGNPVGYTVKTKDRKEEDLFKDFQTVKKSEDIAAIQKRRADKEAKAQRVAAQEQALASSTPDQVIAASGSAQKAIGEYEDVATDLASSENQIMGGIKINNQQIDIPAFRQQIAQAIEQSIATSFSALQSELQQQFSELTIDIPPVDTPEAVIDYKRRVSETQSGLSTLSQVYETSEAEKIKEYSPLQPNESLENLQRNLGQLEEASQALKEAADSISKSSNPSRSLPDSVVDKALDALASRGQMVDLTKTAFKEDETKLGDVVDKIVIGLRAAVNAKQETGSLNDQVVLKAIKAEIKRSNEAMSNISQGGQVQASTPPAQPPTQQPPQTGFNPNDQAPPPGASPNP